MMVSIFDELKKEIDKGISGENESISIGLPKLGNFANIRKRMLTLIFSTSGAGKSGFIDTVILNSTSELMQSPKKNTVKYLLFSTERSKILRLAKWMSFKIFKEYGEVIDVAKLLGWRSEKLKKSELDLISKQKEFFDCLFNDYVTIYEGAKSPTEFFKIMKTYFESIGTYEKTDKYTEIYIPNNEKKIICPIIDHANLTKTTKELNTKKLAIDKLVEFCQGFRDKEASSILWVSQVNRSVAALSRAKDAEYELMLEDVKETGDIGDACDLAFSIFDPLLYKQSSKTGFNPVDFLDKKDGSSYFRSIQILKSTYGQNGLRIPFGFNGFCGQFKELKKRDEYNSLEYDALVTSVLNKSFFIK